MYQGKEKCPDAVLRIALALSLITFIDCSAATFIAWNLNASGRILRRGLKPPKREIARQLRQMTNWHWNRATIRRLRKTKSIISFAIWRRTKSRTTGRTAFANPTLLTLLMLLENRARHSYYATTATLLTANTESTERVYAVGNSNINTPSYVFTSNIINADEAPRRVLAVLVWFDGPP